MKFFQNIISLIFFALIYIYNHLEKENIKIFKKINHKNIAYFYESCDNVIIKRSENICYYLQLLFRKEVIPSKFFIANLIKSSMSIYGQMQEEKLISLIMICLDSVKGDLVEIGSAWGRSAFALARLANYCQIGKLICVDPWEESISVEQVSALTTQQLKQMHWQSIFDSFLINMSGLDAGQCNYIRMSSDKAVKQYETGVISTFEFGTMKLSNNISILHIDANHNVGEVLRDIQLWSKYLVDYSWVIFDDYRWAYGSGPKAVADYILYRSQFFISRSFVSGGHYLLKLKIQKDSTNLCLQLLLMKFIIIQNDILYNNSENFFIVSIDFILILFFLFLILILIFSLNSLFVAISTHLLI